MKCPKCGAPVWVSLLWVGCSQCWWRDRRPYPDDEQALKEETTEPGAEEGGEDIFEMPDGCTKWGCTNAPLRDQGEFRVCSKCGASYGKAI